MKYRDTSKIITFYTKEYGKIKGIAKGARTAKNKFGSALEPLTHSLLVFYKKDNQELHLISQCDAITTFKNLTEDLDRMVSALGVIELVNQVMHDEEPNPAIFSLIVETLTALNLSEKNYDTLLNSFRLRLAAIFGYKPNLELCGECGDQIIMNDSQKQFTFQVAKGAVHCSRCSGINNYSKNYITDNSMYLSISAQGLQFLRRMMQSKISSLANLEYDARIGNEIDELLRLYLQYHFDGIKPLKSTTIFQ
jgi:DNA repair protein RecO (recombination protein O)